jgi:Sporulation and spore germination
MRRGVVILGLVTVACGRPEVTLVPEGDLPADVYASPLPQRTSAADIPDEGTVFLVREGRLVPVARQLSREAPSLPASLVFALLSPVEEGRAHSAIPPDSTLNSVTVTGSTATVDFSTEFELGGSTRSGALRVAQIVYTLTEPETEITAVQVTIEGEEGVPSDDGDTLFGPATRSNYAEFAPHG